MQFGFSNIRYNSEEPGGQPSPVRRGFLSVAGLLGVPLIAGAQQVNQQAAGAAQSRTRGAISILDFGADPTGGSDSTAAIQNALDAGRDVFIPAGIYIFSGLKINQRNTRLHGASTRASILKHTGNGAAIVCGDANKREPDGREAYVESGWFSFENFTLQVNGNFGIRVGKTRSSFTQFRRLYIRHLQDQGSDDSASQYRAGSIAIDCDNRPWEADYATYRSRIEQVFIRGFENAVNLQGTVNAWELSGLYTIECRNQLVLSAVTGLTVSNCYFESGVKGAQGILFLEGGGNQINITGCTFELPNKSATQYAYVFAGGKWSGITVVGAKYLIAGDGNAVNNRRISGAPPAGFVEINRSYNSSHSGALPMIWAPGTSEAAPFQLPGALKIGGFQQGNGRIEIGRNNSDANPHVLQHNGAAALQIVCNGGGLQIQDGAGTTRWQMSSAGGFAFCPGADNAQSLGLPALKLSQVYVGAGNVSTSDERAKAEISDIPDAWLDAWSDVQWQRFKYKDAVKKKGDGARWHVGLIAQRVRDVFQAHGVDPFAIGLLCHDKWDGPGQEEITARDGRGATRNEDNRKPVVAAGDSYGVRYEEALALEAALLRRTTKRLEKRLSMLERNFL